MCWPLTMRTPLIAYATLDDDFDAGLDAGGGDGEVGDGLCVPDDALDTVLPYVSALGKSCLKYLGFDVGERLGPTGGDGGFSGDGGGGPGCLDGAASEPSSESATVTVPAGGDREFDVGNLLTTASEAVTVMPAGGGGGGMVCSALLTLPGEGGVGPENAGMRPLTVPTVPSLPVESGVGQRSDGTRPMAVPAVPQSAVSTTTTATSSPSSLSSWSVENTPSVLAAKPKAVLTRLRRRRRTGHRNRKRYWSLKLPPRLLPAADLDSGDDSGNGNDNDSEYNYSTGGNGNGHCHGFAARHLSRQGRRQCSHCNTADTPQWRVGPAGPGTLCNACGIRFKMNRLLPEYRPSTSPSFVSSHHSNRHKNVLKIREGKVFKDITTSLHCS